MSPSTPGYLFPVMLLESLATITALVFGLNHSLKKAAWTLPERRSAVWSGVILIAFFYAAALIPSRLGFYGGTASRIPTIQYGLLIPIALGILFYLRWPSFRHVVRTIPQPWLVGVQLFRVAGLIFLILLADGKLPAQFAMPAGIGDVLVGLAAPFVALATARGWRYSNALMRTWNLLGLADLVVAVGTGFLTSRSPLQLLALDHPNELIGRYPLVMIPVFLVPIAILLHLVSLQRLRETKSVQHALHLTTVVGRV